MASEGARRKEEGGRRKEGRKGRRRRANWRKSELDRTLDAIQERAINPGECRRTSDLRDTSDVSGKRILVVKAAAQEVLNLLISEPLMNLDAKGWIFGKYQGSKFGCNFGLRATRP